MAADLNDEPPHEERDRDQDQDQKDAYRGCERDIPVIPVCV